MNLPPSKNLPNALHCQPIVHINYLNFIFPHATRSINSVVTLDTIIWPLLRPTGASVDSSAHTFQKAILAPLPVSQYDSTPSPTAISDPVAVYNFGRLFIQWCQNRDGRTAVGLCTVCVLVPLDTAHSTIRLHWVTEDICVCYSLTECYRPKSADTTCGITDRHLVT